MIISIESWGIDLILKIQLALMPALDLPMRFISGLGEEVFYILVIPCLYWCVHKKVGLRLFFFLIFSTILNSMGKWILHMPRPYWIEPGINAKYIETGFGAPSGHSQNALGVWMYLAMLLHQFLKVRFFYYIAALLAVLISFSRLYLGVHFPHDLLSGWFLACLLLFLFWLLAEPISRHTDAGHNPQYTILSTLTLTSFLVIVLWAVMLSFMIRLPDIWQQNALWAHMALGKNIQIDPYSIKTLVSTLAMFVATGLALPLTARYANYDPTGPLLKRIGRYSLGIIIFFLLYIGLSKIFPAKESVHYFEFRFLRYFILGFWVILGAPFIFLKLGLAQAMPDQN